MRELLIRGLLRPLYSAQRRLRPATRPALRAADEGLRFRRRARGWSPERRRAWVLDRLRTVIREAAETTFYERRFRESGFDPWSDFSFDEFASLPPLERHEIADYRGEMRIPSLADGQIWEDATGGSSGSPTVVFKGPLERGWGESAKRFYMGLIGVPPGVRTAFLWGHHLDPVGSDGWRDRLRTLVNNGRWYDCLRLSEEQLGAFHRDLQEWRPRVMVAYASALGALARWVAESGERPRYPMGCFVTGAEKLLPRDRAVAESVFGRPVHERYGGRDVGMMGFQLHPGEGLHFDIDWPNILLEPESAPDGPEQGSGQLSGPGPLSEPGTFESPLLVTKLHGDAMPMIRYRVGDLGLFRNDCRPGHPAFRLEEVRGREMDRLWNPEGAWFHPAGVPHLMKDFPVRDFRLVQASDHSITLEVVKDDAFEPGHREAILKVLRDNLPEVTIRMEELEEIPTTPAGKRKPVVSHVKAPEERTST